MTSIHSAVCLLLISQSSTVGLVDMVVAEVDRVAITYSELLAETRLTLVRSGGQSLAAAATLSTPLLRAVLRSMVHRELLVGEMRRLQLGKISEEEVMRAYEGVRGRFATEGDFLRFLERSGFRNPDSEEIERPEPLLAVLRAELQIERFLNIRVRLAAVISEADLLDCYQKNQAQLQSTFAEAKPRIRATLERQREQRALRSLILQLEKRSRIRYGAGFDPGPLPEDPPEGLRCPEDDQGAK